MLQGRAKSILVTEKRSGEYSNKLFVFVFVTGIGVSGQ